ncbi:MAG: threonine/serine exporter family protein [Clostridia bacterium]|nr:threonine/serine exporter family protein [Clostridia bacterium]
MTENNVSYNRILKMLMDFGIFMIRCGAEINRVEDTVSRLGMSYPISNVSVFAITTSLVITIIDNDGNTYTNTKRIISSATTDFAKLELLNSISRQKCAGEIDDKEFENRFSEIKNKDFGKLKFYVGSMISAGAFTFFFGGNVYDALAAILFSVLIFFIEDKFREYCPNIMMFNFITAFFVGLGISFVSKFCGLNADKIVIGDIMLLIPGVAFTNSMRNLLIGDTLAGVMRLVEAVLWAAALAVGFVVSMMIVGV